MPNKLFKVPFTYTLTAVALVSAADADAAREHVLDHHVFDETNLDESNVFWEEGAMILKSDIREGDPQVMEADEVKDPQEIKDLCEAYEIDLNDTDLSDAEDEDEIEENDDESDNLDDEARNRRDAERG